MYQVGREVQIVGNLIDWDTEVDMAVVLLARHWGGALVPQAQKRCKVAARDAT
ncbi:hypothetical protein PCANC_02380, partial [Puccinia coronata f. sp. avenae]